MRLRNRALRAIFGTSLDWLDLFPFAFIAFAAWLGAVLASPKYDAALWWLP